MDQPEPIIHKIIQAVQQRRTVHLPQAHRLFTGFYEGLPGLVLDRFRSTLVIFDHSPAGELQALIEQISSWAIGHLPGLESVLLKQRQHPDDRMKNGVLIHGSVLPDAIDEYGVNYAVDLQMNQDASFYLDTRELRGWLKANLSGKSVLNTFAYTGSLGVAAGAGGAGEVIQTDVNSNFLKIAEKSWMLNGLPEGKCRFLAGDFFRIAGQLRHQEQRFDCVILDPPFFSTTEAGRVDLEAGTTALINKVRPLVGHEGWLVVINNALFLSGQDFMREINALCCSDYLQIERTIPIPPDVTGYPQTVINAPPADPSPFNHPTKIIILKVFRKDGKGATNSDLPPGSPNG